MAFEESLRKVSLLADSSVAGYTGVPGLPGSASPNNGKMYRFVKVTGKHTVGLATTKASDVMAGVLLNKPQVTGAAATVGYNGIATVESGGGGTAVTAGGKVTCDSSGRAIGASGSDIVYGIALQASSTTGELISVLLK